MSHSRFVSRARSKRDIKRNADIMFDCLVQKTQQKRDATNLIAEDKSINPPNKSPSLPSLKDAIKLTGKIPSRIQSANAPRSKTDVFLNALRLTSGIPFDRTPKLPTRNELRHKDDVHRKAIKSNSAVPPSNIITDHSPSVEYLTFDSSSSSNSSKNTYNQKVSMDLKHQQESNDLNRLCRFCLRQSNENAIRMAWHSWKNSNLALLFEKITNTSLHISKDCSELCCTECNTKLHKTFQTIQLFREANSFWQKLLIIKSEPIEEVKHEQPEYIDNENELIEYLNNTVDDVIFVDEPISVMDDFTDFEFFKVKEPKENPINHYPIKVVEDSPQTLKPAIEYIKTTAEPIETTSFDCKTCKKVYKTARGLAEHKKAIHESMNAYCDICDKNMSTVYGLRRHMQHSHGDIKNDFECKICGNISNCFMNWKTHQLIHSRSMDTITPCDQCDKVFPDRHLMKTHKKSVHSPYVSSICNECGKVFRNRKRLCAHMLLHGSPSLQCEHCKTMFRSRKYITAHMRTVHGQGFPHICDKCGQAFQNLYFGRKHTKNCLGILNRLQRRYKSRFDSLKNSLNCQLCMRPYLVLATLQNHYRNKHTVEECKFLCIQCNQIFTSSQALSDHKNTAHENTQCPVCKKTPFKCNGPACELAFADYYDLLQHKQTKHATRLRYHMVKHTVGTIKCVECGELFRYATQLQTHIIDKHPPLSTPIKVES